MLVTDTLEEEGYEIEQAEDGEEACKKIYETEYDLILLDYMMPKMTGLEVIEKIRRNFDFEKRNVKILMLTAKSQQVDQERVKRAGADYFLAKPFSPIQLVKMIGEIFSE
ncbi:response regulator [Bacillus taeanensis]|uniref:Response regulator n=2 Tax=Bacillus taeanensis TaxID=273032 RepID=A0A366XUD9_9BACI|nr:response regulator [Bacillus taeanensis]